MLRTVIRLGFAMMRSLFVLLSLVACAATPTLSAGDSLGPYVGVRIRDAIKPGTQSKLVASESYQERRGSAVVVGPSKSGGWFVLTNNHVVAPEHTGYVPVPSVYLDGEWRAAKVLGTDPDADLALILVRSAAKLRSVKLASSMPEDGSKVATRAFAAGTQWTTRSATIRHTIALKDGKHAVAPHTHFVNVTFKQGESGGAVIAQGRLVGLIYGNDIENKTGLCVDLSSIKAFLGRWGRDRERAATLTPRPLGR